jgi:hypothetical protein
MSIPGHTMQLCQRNGRETLRGTSHPLMDQPSWRAHRCREAAGLPIRQGTAPASLVICCTTQSLIKVTTREWKVIRYKSRAATHFTRSEMIPI